MSLTVLLYRISQRIFAQMDEEMFEKSWGRPITSRKVNAMKGDSKPLLKYMEGSDTRFVIPVYQRNYDWKRDNCRQLFDDLAKVAKESRPSHFFGSIVSAAEGSENIIIDGQQRLTTVSLLLLALAKLASAGEIPCKRANLPDRIMNDYLVDQWEPEEKKVKLKPVKNDQKAFTRLFGSEKDYILDSVVTQNYLYFCERLRACDLTADEIFEALRKLVIIDISLQQDDNPQLIFESLNSTGLDLSEADKVRNYVLMGLPQMLQEKYYEQYWNRIEDYTNYAVSEFIRQYLTFKQSSWPSINGVYRAFKDYAEVQEGIEPLLQDMLVYARIYNEITNSSTGDAGCNTILARLDRMGMSVANPLLFALLGRLKTGTSSPEDVRRALTVIETYLFRRLACEVPTNSLNKTFATLDNEVRRLTPDDGEYVDAMIYALTAKEGSARFPDDTEFGENVRQRDFYNLAQKNRIYIYDRLENGDSYERVDVPALMTQKEHGLSIEHIMPQTLTESWKRMLGNDWERIHSTWKNRIANLTLTGYNSKYSNRSFYEKLEIKDGFKDSHLYLNKWIAEQTTWGEEQLQQRAELLVQRFMQLWPMPKTDFTPTVEGLAVHTLDDNFDFTGSVLVSFTFRGVRRTINTWREATEEIFRELYDIDPATIRSIALEEVYPGTYIRVGGKAGNGWFRFAPDLFVYLSTPTASKIGILMEVFTRLGIDANELVFEAKVAKEDED